MALVNLTFEQRKWILKCYLANGECGISTKITRPNTIRLFPVGCYKHCCLHLKPTHTARSVAWNWYYMCRWSISRNTEHLPIYCTPLSKMHCCWWWTFWTFVTSNVKISQLCLFTCELWYFKACVYFGDTLYIPVTYSAKMQVHCEGPLFSFSSQFRCWRISWFYSVTASTCLSFTLAFSTWRYRYGAEHIIALLQTWEIARAQTLAQGPQILSEVRRGFLPFLQVNAGSLLDSRSQIHPSTSSQFIVHNNLIN
jgi:hypothetical protein